MKRIHTKLAKRACLILCLLIAQQACVDTGDSVPDAMPLDLEPPTLSTQPENQLSVQELQDPKSCASCHPGPYQEWRGSMHAYASLDPVFLALNARGQEKTGGRLGNFCVNCHAPLAVRLGLTEDGTNLDQVPEFAQGVGCYFCHNVASVEGVNNNPIELANDPIMRGSFGDARENPAHGSAYSSFLDSRHLDSSKMCGACHDVLVPGDLAAPDATQASDLALERTYLEWQSTIFGRSRSEGGLSCIACHMPPSRTRTHAAAVDDAPERTSRRHDFEGIDLALTPFFGETRQRALVDRLLSTTVQTEICLSRTGNAWVTVENIGAGHSFPSGAAHDRRVWLEIKSYNKAGELLFESGQVGARDPVESLEDQELALFRDNIVDGAGEHTNDFWQAQEISRSTLIDGVRTFNPLDRENFHAERHVQSYRSLGPAADIVRITLKLHVRPVGLDVLDDLIATGHLAPDIRDQMQTLTVIPGRCPSPAEIAAAPDLLQARDECDPQSDAATFTLVWDADTAFSGGRNARIDRSGPIPADCIASPGFLP